VKITVDASVFVARLLPEEKLHNAAGAFFAVCDAAGHLLLLPSIGIPEVCGAIARRKRDPAMADLARVRLIQTPRLRIIPVSERLAEGAARLASRLFLRGADAIYCRVAQNDGTELVTFDREVVDRTKGVLKVISPQEWLLEQAAN